MALIIENANQRIFWFAIWTENLLEAFLDSVELYPPLRATRTLWTTVCRSWKPKGWEYMNAHGMVIWIRLIQLDINWWGIQQEEKHSRFILQGQLNLIVFRFIYFIKFIFIKKFIQLKLSFNIIAKLIYGYCIHLQSSLSCTRFKGTYFYHTPVYLNLINYVLEAFFF